MKDMASIVIKDIIQLKKISKRGQKCQNYLKDLQIQRLKIIN